MSLRLSPRRSSRATARRVLGWLIASCLLGTTTSPAVLAAFANVALTTGTIHVVDPWSRAMPSVSKNGAAYMVLTNASPGPDRLLAVESPIAARVEIHTHTMQGGLMKMERVPHVDLPPAQEVAFEPGGLHVMLMGLNDTLDVGKTFPVTLRFEKAEPVTVEVTVRESSGPAMGTRGMKHGTKHGTKQH